MGQQQSQAFSSNNYRNKNNINLSKSLFEFLYVIGRGGFGKVWKVNLKKTQKCYALKEMSKLKIILRRSEKSIQSERELLSNLYHPFLVNMICAFQDYENLYLVMDLFKGGDLRYHLFINKKFTESQTKFFCANIMLGLEYIHKNKIIHRDIKPENLVLDSKGYLAITDFGVAIKYCKNNSNETSGTPGYMAPEVLCSLNHSFFVDFYAVGVMAYEFMIGHRPYLGRNRKEIKEAVLAKQVIVNKKMLDGYGWSFESGDFINRMIQRKVVKRLGYNGINEIKNHLWFQDIDWDELLMKKINSPFIPKEGDNFDKKFCEASDNFGDINGDIKNKYNNFIKRKEFKNLFWNYTYIREEEKKKVIEKYNSDNNNQQRKSYIKIIQGDKRYPLRINNNNIQNNNGQTINDENKNIININIKTNKINTSKSTSNLFNSLKINNNQVFHKKRASKKSIDNIQNEEINNNVKNYNMKYRNSVIIINPHYNQNINYFSNNNLFNEESLISKNTKNIFLQNDNSIHGKTKSFDNFNIINNLNNNTIEVGKTKEIKIKLRNDLKTTRKKMSNVLQPSYSLKTMRKNIQINVGDKTTKNIEKERIIYSPPHILSPKINSKNKNKNKLISPEENINLENNNNPIKVFSTRNKKINYLNENNNDNYKKILVNKENYSTLDYTLDKPIKHLNHSPSNNLHLFNNNISYRNSCKEINPNNINKSKNINDNSFVLIEKNNDNLYSTINNAFYKKNNSTISYSSENLFNNNKQSNKHPSSLYSHSQLMNDLLFNNINYENNSFNKYKLERNSFEINKSNNNTSSNKIINSISHTLEDKNNFNKRKNIKNNIQRYANLNHLVKNNNIHSKFWLTSEKNNNKNYNSEQSFSNSLLNNKENIHNNYLNNTKKNNITQIKVTLIPKPHIKNKKNNV